MKLFGAIISFVLASSQPATFSDSRLDNDYKIARAVRQAVRDADSTLLATTDLKVWRDYLKIATVDLSPQLQALLLIKFDEDMKFRTQLKTLIEWEDNTLSTETEHFIYYYHGDHQPPPDILIQAQEAHFNEVMKLFQIEAVEKIPFRYNLNAEENGVYPFDDLRGGIVSNEPFDPERTVTAILRFVTEAPEPLLEPLTKIYGSNLQSPSTSQTYFEKCLKHIQYNGYHSMTNLFRKTSLLPDSVSLFTFIYQVDRKCGPDKLVEFLATITRDTDATDFAKQFVGFLGIDLTEFENQIVLEQPADDSK